MGENLEFMNGWISTVFKHGVGGKVMTSSELPRLDLEVI